MNFPCYLFHRDFGAMRVEDEGMLATLPDVEGWQDNPQSATEFAEQRSKDEAVAEEARLAEVARIADAMAAEAELERITRPKAQAIDALEASRPVVMADPAIAVSTEQV